MRRLFKWTLRVTLILAALVVLLFVFKDSIIRAITERRIRDRTGLEVSIGRLSAGVFSPTLTIENLKLYNTAEFGGTPFLIVPELHLECDPVALAEHKLRITTMRLNLAELDIVKNEAGKTNVISLAAHVEKRMREQRARDHSASWKFDGIDTLNLTLGTARLIDWRLGKKTVTSTLIFRIRWSEKRQVGNRHVRAVASALAAQRWRSRNRAAGLRKTVPSKTS